MGDHPARDADVARVVSLDVRFERLLERRERFVMAPEVVQLDADIVEQR